MISAQRPGEIRFLLYCLALLPHLPCIKSLNYCQDHGCIDNGPVLSHVLGVLHQLFSKWCSRMLARVSSSLTHGYFVTKLQDKNKTRFKHINPHDPPFCRREFWRCFCKRTTPLKIFQDTMSFIVQRYYACGCRAWCWPLAGAVFIVTASG